jgi:hypothetical protein
VFKRARPWTDLSLSYINLVITLFFKINFNIIRQPFAKFVDSPYYSESEICGHVVAVSFSKYLPWQAMHFLQRSTHLSKMCCRPFAASFKRVVEQAVFLPRSSLFMVGKAQKSHGERSGLHRLDG